MHIEELTSELTALRDRINALLELAKPDSSEFTTIKDYGLKIKKFIPFEVAQYLGKSCSQKCRIRNLPRKDERNDQGQVARFAYPLSVVAEVVAEYESIHGELPDAIIGQPKIT
jgi:hypothetical protein